MKRRQLVVTLTSLMSPLSLAHAQVQASRRVGVLAPSTRAREEVTLGPFFDEMQKLGWLEGQNIFYERVYADDQQQVLPRLAAELVARKPDLIYAPPPAAAVAARRATQTIPIVFATGGDPVAAGLVASLSNPGGNVTGVITVIDSQAPKRLELLREILPSVKRLGLIGDPADPRMNSDRAALAKVAPALGVSVLVVEAAGLAAFEAGLASLSTQHVDAIMAVSSQALNLRERLVALTIKQRVPVVSGNIAIAEAGALFIYGASVAGQIRRSAHLVDKVLKGAKPADIPVEQPTTFKLVVNQKTAKALGITIPQSILLRADEVIE
jgi:putative tryptophan/tyrosine transport system substrate-binding protein